MGKSRRIRTILNGDQKLDATELDLLHTPALQRLYDLHQLGLADRVFLDASHARLHHVVGVLQQVDNLVAATIQNLEAKSTRELTYYSKDGNQVITAGELADYVRKRKAAVRLMGLLHDLTHSPFGHTLEDEIQLIKSKHDEPLRQANAFYRLLCQYISWLTRDCGKEESVEGTWGSTLRTPDAKDEPKSRLARYLDAPDLLQPPEDEKCIELLANLAAKQLIEDNPARHMSREASAEDLCQFLHDLYFAMRGLLYLDCIHKDDPKPKDLPHEIPGSYSFEKLLAAILKAANQPLSDEDVFYPQRDAFLLDIIGNTICADLLDYAKRDSHFAGLRLDYDAHRIVENFTLVSHPEKQGPFPAPLIRTAISIFSHKLRLDVPGELLNLLQVRFYLSQRVLFHPTKCIAGAMLGAALQLIGWKELPDHLAFVGDSVFLHQVSETARIVRDLLKAFAVPSSELLDKALHDDILSRLNQIPPTGITVAATKLIHDRLGQPLATIQSDLRAAIRLLDRMFTRRYHRPIFRVLPGIDPALSTNASDIADIFRNPEKRYRIERKIEEAAGLPRGTIVIHCPNSEGPRKIAAMLLAMNDTHRPHKLRDVGSLNALFDKHQKAIRALEDMYASMWRLVVAVAPPFRPDYVRINKCIAQALYGEITAEKLGTRKEGELANDLFMIGELDAATAKAPAKKPKRHLRVRDGRGLEIAISSQELELGRHLIDLVRETPVVRDFLASENLESAKEVAEKVRTEMSSKDLQTMENKASPIEPSTKPVDFSGWFKSTERQISDPKTKKQFRNSKERLEEIVIPLTPEQKVKFFANFAQRMANQSETVANYVNADQIIAAASETATQLTRTSSDEADPKQKSLFDGEE